MFFVLLHVRLAFLWCFEFVILFYFPLLARRYRCDSILCVGTIIVAIPEQMCCVRPMRLHQLFSALFALKFRGLSCIFNHVIQWHFGTSWMEINVAALTLQCGRFKFCVECVTHYVCLGDILRPCHCCCCLFSLFRNLQFFILFYLFLRRFFFQYF